MCITPRRNDFTVYRTSKVKIKDLSKSNTVTGEGFMRWKVRNTSGKIVNLDLPGYHIPMAEVRLLSPQVLLSTCGKNAKLFRLLQIYFSVLAMVLNYEHNTVLEVICHCFKFVTMNPSSETFGTTLSTSLRMTSLLLPLRQTFLIAKMQISLLHRKNCSRSIIVYLVHQFVGFNL